MPWVKCYKCLCKLEKNDNFPGTKTAEILPKAKCLEFSLPKICVFAGEMHTFSLNHLFVLFRSVFGAF